MRAVEIEDAKMASQMTELLMGQDVSIDVISSIPMLLMQRLIYKR